VRPLVELDGGAIDAIFTDIDDTLTTEGLVEAEAFAAIWDLHRANIPVVLVTGRPAGWCDHLARMWPVAGVIGENGAFWMRYLREARRFESIFVLEQQERDAQVARLATVKDAILAAVPNARVASDQPFRIHDLAIDFCEDVVPPLSAAEIDRIVAVFEAHGAIAKVSSIHVNGWFGRYDKLGMIERFAREVLGMPDLSRAAYVGDSPNDEPAFRAFEHAIGVANVRDFAARLVHPPKLVTEARGGRGFAEVAAQVLRR